MALFLGNAAQDSAPLRQAGPGPLELFAAAAAAACDETRFLAPIPLNEPEDSEDRLAICLSAAERQRAARFRRPQDRLHYLVTHARLRELLAECLEISPGQVALDCNRFGKLELSGRQASSGWHFSLSYSDGSDGGLALCALARHRRIGVDVERVRRLDDAGILARHFFSPREYALYLSLPPSDRLLGFFNCWTRKEAFVKALGTGLSHDLAAFAVSLAPDTLARFLHVDEASGEDCGWCLHGIGPAGGRVAAVVTERIRS